MRDHRPLGAVWQRIPSPVDPKSYKSPREEGGGGCWIPPPTPSQQHFRKPLPPPPQVGSGRDVLEERRGGRGEGTEKIVYHKWPARIFPMVTFVFFFFVRWSLWSGEGGGGCSSYDRPCGGPFTESDRVCMFRIVLCVAVMRGEEGGPAAMCVAGCAHGSVLELWRELWRGQSLPVSVVSGIWCLIGPPVPARGRGPLQPPGLLLRGVSGVGPGGERLGSGADDNGRAVQGTAQCRRPCWLCLPWACGGQRHCRLHGMCDVAAVGVDCMVYVVSGAVRCACACARARRLLAQPLYSPPALP